MRVVRWRATIGCIFVGLSLALLVGAGPAAPSRPESLSLALLVGAGPATSPPESLSLALLAGAGPAAPSPPESPSLSSTPGVEPADPVASYNIEATLSSDGKVIRGHEIIRYRNLSQDVLGELYLHLYLNAFRSGDTIWMREAGAQHRGFGFDQDHAGSIDVESVLVRGRPVELDPDDQGTIARVSLEQPLPPGEDLAIEITWTSYLPRVFARTGWAPGGFTMAGQWYPKLAVYDSRRGGWDNEPWHANAEFFHDFGDYDLAVTAPVQRTVVANGEPSTKEDHSDGTSTWYFTARSVTDVVWLAAEGYLVQTQSFDGKVLAVAVPQANAGLAPRYFEIAQYALRRYQGWLGPYPWPRLTIVVPAENAGGAGGMEYPALVTAMLPIASTIGGIRDLEMVTAHELAHEWFPMQVASDEAREPWLDEAFAEYLTQRVLGERYGEARALVDLPFARLGYLAYLRAGMVPALRLPVTLRSWDYQPGQYASAVYAKGAALLATLQGVVGDEAFTSALLEYVDQWRWRHPTSSDFQAALNAGLARSGKGPVDPWIDQLGSGERVLMVQVAEASVDRAVVRRTGDAALEVEGVLQLESGRSMPWVLAGEEDRLELSAPAGERIAAVIADPYERLVIAPAQVSDSLTVHPQSATLAGIVVRLVELAALALQMLAQFG